VKGIFKGQETMRKGLSMILFATLVF